ncbi:MAG TPA: ATP-binding protein [Vicinamibacteria bacterium]
MRFRLDPRVRTDEAGRFAWAEEVAEAVGQEARGQGLAEDEVYYLGAAVREALLNALSHGRDPGGEPWVSVDVDCQPGFKLVVTVRDRGPGFDPQGVPDPREPDRCSGSCGRGLFFMRRFTDRVSFAFPGLGGSRVRLEKLLPEPTGASNASTAGDASLPDRDRTSGSG